ncbi:unnamed protein product [Paramecium sonneborni]|uniref:Uncharacterized protein n=1 Tax=Paramecium sonneborni TaxID=65129 RepID=A0A8S1P9F5_9CILI|nr:unnamed protein product [Paramecium sonneborni]
MKLNLRLSNIRKKYDHFSYILSELINQDINIQLTIFDSNPKTDILIQKLEFLNFLNLDNFYQISLREFSDIIKYDKNLESNLKQYISQLFNTQIIWFIQDQFIFTHLDCEKEIHQFLNKLFYCQTQFIQYVDYMKNNYQIQAYSPQQEAPLKGYKNSIQKQQNSTQKLYTLYGFKKQLKSQDVFTKKVVRHEQQYNMHYVFIEFYVPQIKEWIEKYLYTYVEVRKGQQIIDLYGPYHLVSKAEEILFKEYSALNPYCGILKFKDLDDDSIQLMQIKDALIQNSYYDYEVDKKNQNSLEELENSLKTVKSKIFSAILVIDYKNAQLCDNAKFYFNFDLDRKNIEIQLEKEIYKLAQTQLDGKAISYFAIINGGLQHSIFLKKLNDDLEIFRETIYNNIQINYLRNQKIDVIHNIQNQYQIKLKFQQNCIVILGRKQQLDYFIQFLMKITSPQAEIIDFYFFKNQFNFKQINYDYKDRFQRILQQCECQSSTEQQELRIKISSKDANKINKLKSQLQQLETELDCSKKTIQISIEKTENGNLNQIIQQVSQKYPVVDIRLGQNDYVGLQQICSFTKKQTIVKVYYGLPNYPYDVVKGVLNLKNSMILIPIEKIHNQFKENKILWIEKLIQQNNISLVNQKQNSSLEIFQYELYLQDKEIDPNQIQKYKQEKIELTICYIYYRDLLNPQNFIHFFEKQNLIKTYGKAIDEIQILKPSSIIINNLIEKDGKELSELVDYIKQLDFPQIELSFMINDKNDLNEIKKLLNGIFEEDNHIERKKVYQLSITGCLQDTIEQVIKELNEV